MIVVCENNINRGNSWREKESNTKLFVGQMNHLGN